jgi:peptide/nickel transport system ATP-binding protein
LFRVEGVSLSYGGGTIMHRLMESDPIVVVRDASFDLQPGQTLALVGESGSGKSTIARAAAGLLPPMAGTIAFKGEPLPPRVEQRSRAQRREVQFIFQNPDASLNPRARVDQALARPLAMFFGLARGEIRDRMEQALHEVRLDASYARRYPDELSGGERQRVAIARALVADPQLLLCDEILSALDVSVQANIITLLRRLQAETNVAMLFISHDLAVVRNLAHKVAVLYHGQIMETGDVDE